MTTTWISGVSAGLPGEGRESYFMSAAKEVCTQHINVVFHTADTGVEEVAHHAVQMAALEDKYTVMSGDGHTRY